jgi:tetratricopeptide (TPR) repeat protein
MRRHLPALLTTLTFLAATAAMAAPTEQAPPLPRTISAPDAAYQEGLSRFVANDLAASEAAFRRTLTLDPKRADALLGLAEIAFRRNKADEAKGLIRKAVALDPGSAHAHASLGRSLAIDRKYDDAERALKQAIALDGKLVRPRIDLADLYATALRKPADATRLYEEAIALDPGHAGAHYALGVTLAGSDRVDDARLMLVKAASLEPRNPLPPMALARLSARTGNLATAQEWVAKALDIDAALPDALDLRADLLSAQGDTARAIEQYRAIAAAQPANGMAHTKIGSIHQRAGRNAEAITAYREAVRRTPRNPIALNNLAFLLAESGKYDEASTFARSAVAAAPGDGMILDTLGAIELRKGNHRDAVATLSKAAAAAPRVALIQFHLGQAQLAAGQKGDARTSLQTALDAEPGANWAGEARRLLDGIDGR